MSDKKFHFWALVIWGVLVTGALWYASDKFEANMAHERQEAEIRRMIP